jgi:hypothetical protein
MPLKSKRTWLKRMEIIFIKNFWLGFYQSFYYSNVRSDYIEISTSNMSVPPNTPQPQRTDLELVTSRKPVQYNEKFFNSKEEIN